MQSAQLVILRATTCLMAGNTKRCYLLNLLLVVIKCIIAIIHIIAIISTILEPINSSMIAEIINILTKTMA